MKPTVHILATGTDNPNMTLVFQTLPTGFPTAHVKVHARPMTVDQEIRLQDAVAAAQQVRARTGIGVRPIEIGPTEAECHGKWMDSVVERWQGPVVFLDTDVVFHAPVEHWEFSTGLAGRYIRRFREPLTRCVSEPRLHPSLLFVNPEQVRRELDVWRSGFNVTRFNPPAVSFAAFTLAERTRAGVVPHFYDTGSALYQAIGGNSFTESQLDAYDHLFAGTFVDELSPAIEDADLAGAHRQAWQNPTGIRGAWRHQNQWFARRAC